MYKEERDLVKEEMKIIDEFDMEKFGICPRRQTSPLSFHTVGDHACMSHGLRVKPVVSPT